MFSYSFLSLCLMMGIYALNLVLLKIIIVYLMKYFVSLYLHCIAVNRVYQFVLILIMFLLLVMESCIIRCLTILTNRDPFPFSVIRKRLTIFIYHFIHPYLDNTYYGTTMSVRTSVRSKFSVFISLSHMKLELAV